MVRVRIAPSPTGYPHIGTIFQALINYAIAKNAKPQGKFIVRIEDTDRTRFVEGAEEKIYEALDWFNLTEDESPRRRREGDYGPYRQSEKLEIYQERAQWLVDHGKAYYCFCTPEELDTMRKKQQLEGKSPMYNRTCRDLDPKKAAERAKKEPHVIRMRIIYGGAILKIHDDIRGDIEFKKDLIDDQVILKSDEFPTYHLAVVVDDHDMKITHVVRGEEWISSTPKHVLLYQYFGWNPPSFGSVKSGFVVLHTPLLRNPDGSKLSKRHGHAAVSWYKEQGFLPEAILNYLASLVYNYPKGEIFSLGDFVDSFDRTKIHSVGARFDLTKLKWMNGEHIRMMDNKTLKIALADFYKDDLEIIKFLESEESLKILDLAKTRMKTLKDFKNLVIPTKPELSNEEKNVAKTLLENFSKIDSWTKEAILSAMRETLNVHKAKGSVLYKIATGYESGLPLPDSLEILGKEKAIERIKKSSE